TTLIVATTPAQNTRLGMRLRNAIAADTPAAIPASSPPRLWVSTKQPSVSAPQARTTPFVHLRRARQNGTRSHGNVAPRKPPAKSPLPIVPNTLYPRMPPLARTQLNGSKWSHWTYPYTVTPAE